jgi:hypothetical protein
VRHGSSLTLCDTLTEMCLSTGFIRQSCRLPAASLPTQTLVNAPSYHTDHAFSHRSDGNGLVSARLAFKEPAQKLAADDTCRNSPNDQGAGGAMTAGDPFKSIHGRGHQWGD